MLQWLPTFDYTNMPPRDNESFCMRVSKPVCPLGWFFVQAQSGYRGNHCKGSHHCAASPPRLVHCACRLGPHAPVWLLEVREIPIGVHLVLVPAAVRVAMGVSHRHYPPDESQLTAYSMQHLLTAFTSSIFCMFLWAQKGSTQQHLTILYHLNVCRCITSRMLSYSLCLFECLATVT